MTLGGTIVGVAAGDERRMFNSPRGLLFGRRQMSVQEWRARAEHRGFRLSATVRPRPSDLVGVRYDDPHGGSRICYHTEVADLEVRLERVGKDGGGDVVFEAAERAAAAFEYASLEEVPGLPILV